jgi:transcriptional regulator with XRE-family HTH domain
MAIYFVRFPTVRLIRTQRGRHDYWRSFARVAGRKRLSQGDIEKRTGLLRCYISRVENGHTVPAIETLEKLARAMEVPPYQLFYDGDKPSKLPNLL